MRVLIVSDLHANPYALAVLPEADATLCAGDLVDFGPDPAATIAWCRRRKATVVLGNHDFALSTGADCGVKGTMREASVQSRAAHARMLTNSDRAYLRELPEVAIVVLDGTTFAITHAVPDDVYRYVRLDVAGARLRARVPEADVLIAGHTHIQGCMKDGPVQIVNPGSTGVASTGSTVHYALWEDGKVTLHAQHYDAEQSIAKLRALELDDDAFDAIATALRKGRTRSEKDFASD